jgi:CHASE2 domain-containing sensor protein
VAHPPGATRTLGRLGALVCVAVAAFGLTLAARETGAIRPLERESLQARYDVRGPEPADGLLVVGIDDRTFGELGRAWPFPRSLHGRVVRRLHDAGAREIVYDIQFTEPTKPPSEDLALFDSLAYAGGAVLATSESDGRGNTNVLGGDDNLRSIGARAAASDLRNDSSGTIASFPAEVGGLASIAAVTAERVSGRRLDRSGLRDGRAWIDFRGPPGTIRTVSFSDVLRGEVADGVIRNRIVVVGATAPTLQDVHPTPVGGEALMAGAEVQANAIWTALHDLPLRSAPPALELLLLALMALLAPLTRWRLPLAAVGAVTAGAAIAFLAGAQAAFDRGRGGSAPRAAGRRRRRGGLERGGREPRPPARVARQRAARAARAGAHRRAA